MKPFFLFRSALPAVDWNFSSFYWGRMGRKNIKFSNLLAISVPDEGYSRNDLCAFNLISMFYYIRNDG
jgi:hypothetical protein